MKINLTVIVNVVRPEDIQSPQTEPSKPDEVIDTSWMDALLNPRQLWKPREGMIGVKCDCGWSSQYETEASAKMGLGSHMRHCRGKNTSNT